MTDQGGSGASREHNHIHYEGLFVSDCPVCVVMDDDPNSGSGAGSTTEVLFSTGLLYEDMVEAQRVITRLRADLAAARAEVQRLTEVLAAARHFRGAVNDAMAHQSRCQDSPCDRCDRTVFVEDAAESALFDALDRLDAAEKARTATPEGPLSAPSSQPPQPEQAT